MNMIDLEILWAWSGTLYLLILCYQDIRHNRSVDDRLNYFMLGLTTAILSIVTNKLWYNIFIIFFSIGLVWLSNKYQIVGAGDGSAFRWVLIGFGLLGITHLIAFLLSLGIMTGVYSLLKFKVFKFNKPTPYFPVVLVIFISNCIAGGFY